MKVKKITDCGGACPYQCEGFLEDGREFYLRYRSGNLTLRAWDQTGTMMADKSVVFREGIGGEFDGWPNNDLFHQKLDAIIEFPKDFIFQYDYITPDR